MKRGTKYSKELEELEEALEEWIYLRLYRNLTIPPMGGAVIKAPSTA